MATALHVQGDIFIKINENKKDTHKSLTTCKWIFSTQTTDF